MLLRQQQNDWRYARTRVSYSQGHSPIWSGVAEMGMWQIHVISFFQSSHGEWENLGLEFHFASPSFKCFWLAAMETVFFTESCSKRSITECKSTLGFTKTEDGEEGSGAHLSFPVFFYSLWTWALSNRSKSIRANKPQVGSDCSLWKASPT